MSDLKNDLEKYLSDFITPKRLGLFQQAAASRTRFLTVVLEDVFDPSDASAVMRSCECFGVQDLHIISQRTKFKVSSGVAVGASKWISLHQYKDPDANNTDACLDRLEENGYSLVAIRPDAPSIQELPTDKKMALCLGSGSLGLSENLLSRVHASASIPTAGFTQTFNISVCAALCLADLRERMVHAPWQLSDEEQQDLRLEWLAKMPKRIKQLVARFLVERKLDVSALEHAGVTPAALKSMI